MKITINDINIERSTTKRIIESIDKLIHSFEIIPFEDMIKNEGYDVAFRLANVYKRRISSVVDFLLETGIIYSCGEDEIDNYVEMIYQNRFLNLKDGKLYFKWNNQTSDLWPDWFKNAIKENGFFIKGNELFLVTDEGDCGGGRYLVDQGDYAVKEMDGSYSSRSRWVVESEAFK